jgi:hypothetical protein
MNAIYGFRLNNSHCEIERTDVTVIDPPVTLEESQLGAPDCITTGNNR